MRSPNPIPQASLLQELLGEVLEVAFGENYIRGHGDLVLTCPIMSGCTARGNDRTHHP